MGDGHSANQNRVADQRLPDIVIDLVQVFIQCSFVTSLIAILIFKHVYEVSCF